MSEERPVARWLGKELLKCVKEGLTFEEARERILKMVEKK